MYSTTATAVPDVEIVSNGARTVECPVCGESVYIREGVSVTHRCSDSYPERMIDVEFEFHAGGGFTVRTKEGSHLFGDEVLPFVSVDPYGKICLHGTVNVGEVR
jgi:hypothetical protein